MVAYFGNVLVLSAAYAVLALSLNMVMGHAKMFSSAQGVFFGVGAYAGAFISKHVTGDFIVAVLFAMAASAVVAIPLSFIALRIKGDYFIVVSLAFQQIFSVVFIEWTQATGGSAGFTVPNTATIGSLHVTYSLDEALITGWVCVAIVLVVVGLLLRSSFGRALRALGQDETAARSLGRRVVGVRLTAVVISAALAAIGGVLYAFFIGYVDPSSFTVTTSILVAAMVVLGGMSSLTGPVIGVLVLELLPAALAFFKLVTPTLQGPVQGMLYGAGLIVVAVWRPEGLVGIFRSAVVFAKKLARRRPSDEGRDRVGESVSHDPAVSEVADDS